MYFFTADEHYGHAKIIDYCKRPFTCVEVMDEVLVQMHNEKVGKNDVTVHIGDFGWFKSYAEAMKWTSRLHGNHIFIKGSHDHWMSNTFKYMWRREIDGQFIVACHYALRTWDQAYHGSWNLYGHSHGTLPPIGKQHDVGVDNNKFAPVSFDEMKVIMALRPMLHGAEHDRLLQQTNREIDEDIIIEERMME